MRKSASRQWKAIIEHDEDGYYVASVPALPGCHTQAKSMGELRKRLREVIDLCLAHAAKDRVYRSRIKALAYEPTFVGLESVTV